MSVLDVHCYLGGSVLPGVGSDGPSVMAALRTRDISHAVAISSHALAVDVCAGNRLLRAAVERTDGLYGCLAASINRPEESVASLRELASGSRMVGAVLVGRTPGDPISRVHADTVLNAYRRYGKPLFLMTPNAAAADAALEIARAYTMLKVVLLGMGGEDWRIAIEVAAAATNVFLETSGSPDTSKIPAAVAELGCHRIVFGSGFPHVDPVVALSSLSAADLGEDAYRRIAAQNAHRLLDLAG